MSAYSVQARDGVYQLTLGDISLSVDNARIRSTGVRCSIAVYRGTAVLYRDIVGLGAAAARAKLSTLLAAKNLDVPEEALLALEETIRNDLITAPRSPNGKVVAFPGSTPPAPTPKTLDEAHAVFRKWLRLPDTSALDIAIAAVIANHFPGDPIWLLLVDAPGSGKTEIVNAMGDLPNVRALASLTEAYLLSGISEKDRVTGASGGFLKEIGKFGILALKDFGSILALQQDTRSIILQALREIYDGHWSRGVGTDGGLTLDWAGKLGIIGGATPAIDRYHSVLAALGERFVFFRPVTSEIEKRARAHRAIQSIQQNEQESIMRVELRAAICGLFAGLDLTSPPAGPGDLEDYLVCLASLTANARSPVDRDRYSHEITDVPSAEHPARVAKVLTRLYLSLTVLGIPPERAWQLTRHTALSSVPKLRYLVLTTLARSKLPINTTELTSLTDSSPDAIRRAAFDLVAHHLVHRESGGSGKADIWCLSDEARMLWTKVTSCAVRTALAPRGTSSAIRDDYQVSINLTPERDRERLHERESTSSRIAEEVTPAVTQFTCRICSGTKAWRRSTGEDCCVECGPTEPLYEAGDMVQPAAHIKAPKWAQAKIVGDTVLHPYQFKQRTVQPDGTERYADESWLMWWHQLEGSPGRSPEIDLEKVGSS